MHYIGGGTKVVINEWRDWGVGEGGVAARGARAGALATGSGEKSGLAPCVAGASPAPHRHSKPPSRNSGPALW